MRKPEGPSFVCVSPRGWMVAGSLYVSVGRYVKVNQAK